MNTPQTPSGAYKVEGYDTWDNFVIEAGGVLHRYTLCARGKLGQDRHLEAALRHAVSTDGGLNWEDRGVVLEVPEAVRQGAAVLDDTWPNQAIWGSNGIVRTLADGRFQFILFVSGCSKPLKQFPQRIGVATSNDGQHFTPLKPVLNPTAEKGYDITNSDGVIMAWRDPFVFRDSQDGRWHMLFAAKAACPAGGTPIATVGHAVAPNEDLERWGLQHPLQLPQHYRQLEVPSLVQRGGWCYLFVSTQNNPDKDTNEAKEAAFRGYVAPSLLGPWKPIHGDADMIYGHKVYAALVFERRQASGQYAAVAFFSEDTGFPITATPIIDIKWEVDKHLGWEIPVFDFRALEPFLSLARE